jgi:hypothetical protein
MRLLILYFLENNSFYLFSILVIFGSKNKQYINTKIKLRILFYFSGFSLDIKKDVLHNFKEVKHISKDVKYLFENTLHLLE